MSIYFMQKAIHAKAALENRKTIRGIQMRVLKSKKIIRNIEEEKFL